MARVVVNVAADADIDDIFESVRDASGYEAAVARDAAFTRFYDRLMAFPESGSPRPALGVGIRIGVVAPYLIIYRYDEAADTVFVLRIMHGHRDIGPAVLGPPA